MASGDIEAGRAHVVIRLRDQVSAGLKHVERSLTGFGKSFASAAYGVAGSGAAAAAGFGAVLGALAFPTKLAADMETLRASFLTLTKSAATTDTLLAKITKAAAQTPFEMPELASTAKTLMAFGSSADTVVDEMLRIGDVASAINAPIGEIAEVYGKARVQGRLFASDINQLTGRGIPIIQELAKQFGVTDDAVKDLVENGQVNFGHLEKAFVSLTTGAGLFAGGMARASATVAGKWSTLKDTIAETVRPIGEALLPVVSSLLTTLTDILTPLGAVIKQYAGLAIAVGGVAAAGVVAGVALTTMGTVGVAAAAALTFAATTVSTAWGIASGLMATALSPVVVPVLAIVAAVGLLYAAIAAVGIAVGVQSGLLGQAFTWVKDRASEMAGGVMQAFTGISNALKAGQYVLAARILWAGLKLVFWQGVASLLDAFKKLWENAWTISKQFFSTLLSQVWRVFTSIPKLLQAALSGGKSFAEIIANALTGELSFGDLAGKQVEAARAELAALNAQVKGSPNAAQTPRSQGAVASSQTTQPQPQPPTAQPTGEKTLDEQFRALREKRFAHEYRSYTSAYAFDQADAALRQEEMQFMKKVADARKAKQAELDKAKTDAVVEPEPDPEVTDLTSQVSSGLQTMRTVSSSGTFSAAGAAASLGFNAQPMQDTAKNTRRLVTLFERNQRARAEFG